MGSRYSHVYIFDVYVGVSKWVVCCDVCSGIYIGVPSLIVDNWFYVSAIIQLWGWAEMKTFAGTLTTKRVDRVVAYKECTYVCHRLYR